MTFCVFRISFILVQEIYAVPGRSHSSSILFFRDTYEHPITNYSYFMYKYGRYLLLKKNRSLFSDFNVYFARFFRVTKMGPFFFLERRNFGDLRAVPRNVSVFVGPLACASALVFWKTKHTMKFPGRSSQKKMEGTPGAPNDILWHSGKSIFCHIYRRIHRLFCGKCTSV